jgi:hypothetical protein
MRRFRTAAALVGLALLASACGSGSSPKRAETTTRPSVSVATTTEVSTTTAAPPTSTTTPATTTTTAGELRYLPLFPFGDLQEAVAWQQGYGKAHQQDRYDAGPSALAFAHFLGYGEIDRVVAVAYDSRGAHVAVGYESEGDRVVRAAVVHLIRFGTGSRRPWEVVGTDDTNFTIDVPPYGAVIGSPVEVGGRITGVDESITVHIQQLHANGALGEHCCTPAGGQNSRWSSNVSFQPPTDAILIISAATGGHIQDVERFSVTGVKRS